MIWYIKEMRNIKRFYGLASLASLGTGMGIYFFFRNTNMLLFEWMPKFIIFNNVYIPINHSILSSMLLYNLPDMLWFLSGILFLRYLWFNNKQWQGIYVICFYGIAIIIETSQLFTNIPGTFDWLDLSFMGIGAFVEGLLYNNFVRRRIV